MTEKEAHFEEKLEAIVSPNRKQFDVCSIKLFGPFEDPWCHFKYDVGDRIWDMDAPRFLRRAKEKMWKFFVSDYILESNIPKKYVVCGTHLCNKPFLRILHADGRKEEIEFESWEEGEKKYNELVRRFRLIKRPY